MLDTVLEVSFTADDKHVVAAGGDKALRMWTIQTGQVRHTLTGHTAKVWVSPRHLPRIAKVWVLQRYGSRLGIYL